MKGLMSIIEVLITGMILFIAFLHFFPQYVIRTKWDGILLHVKVMDTINTIDRMEKTYEFATCSTAFNDFMSSLFKPEYNGAMIWWKETEGISGYTEDTHVPYFSKGYKETMIGFVSGIVLFEDDFNRASIGPDWTENDDDNWYIEDNEYFCDPPAGKSRSSIVNVDTEDNITIEVTYNETSACCGDWIIFDYKDTGDFKFAGIHYSCSGNNYTEIGHWDGSSLNFDKREVISGVQPKKNEFYRLKVKISEKSKVTLYLDGQEKISYTFASLGDGKIGLGAHDGEAYFDDFVIKRIVNDAYSFTMGLGHPF